MICGHEVESCNIYEDDCSDRVKWVSQYKSLLLCLGTSHYGNNALNDLNVVGRVWEMHHPYFDNETSA
jgi:hypothetical protein